MKVFKFGGASVKDADGVRNVASILNRFRDEEVLVVISAMGKITNALEELVTAYIQGQNRKYELFAQVKQYHSDIIRNLQRDDRDALLYQDIDNLLMDLECMIEKKPEKNADFVYDQIVSFGEILSTRIVSIYLNQSGVRNRWVDARNFILTDSNYREGRIQWTETCDMISKKLKPMAKQELIVTQGFIGKTPTNTTTTLGREGSDYSAAIFAYALKAESVTIWKDVAGVMNADPKRIPDAIKLDELTYNHAIELAYYGATVIHPKTIQPLKSRNIPLLVKSFINPEAKGTVVGTEQESAKTTKIPNYIFKTNQALVSISSKDFSFIVEENLSHIFSRFAKSKVKINLMQNSAISFSVCVNNEPAKLAELRKALSKDFAFEITEDVDLITIYNPAAAKTETLLKNRQLLLEQRMKQTIQFVVK